MYDSSTLINFHPNKYDQGLLYYPFAAISGRCMGSCNTHNNLSNRVCVPNKKERFKLDYRNK